MNIGHGSTMLPLSCPFLLHKLMPLILQTNHHLTNTQTHSLTISQVFKYCFTDYVYATGYFWITNTMRELDNICCNVQKLIEFLVFLSYDWDGCVACSVDIWSIYYTLYCVMNLLQASTITLLVSNQLLWYYVGMQCVKDPFSL